MGQKLAEIHSAEILVSRCATLQSTCHYKSGCNTCLVTLWTSRNLRYFHVSAFKSSVFSLFTIGVEISFCVSMKSANHTSLITHHTPHIAHHTSHITHRTSHFTDRLQSRRAVLSYRWSEILIRKRQRFHFSCSLIYLLWFLATSKCQRQAATRTNGHTDKRTNGQTDTRTNGLSGRRPNKYAQSVFVDGEGKWRQPPPTGQKRTAMDGGGTEGDRRRESIDIKAQMDLNASLKRKKFHHW